MPIKTIEKVGSSAPRVRQVHFNYARRDYLLRPVNFTLPVSGTALFLAPAYIDIPRESSCASAREAKGANGGRSSIPLQPRLFCFVLAPRIMERSVAGKKCTSGRGIIGARAKMGYRAMSPCEKACLMECGCPSLFFLSFLRVIFSACITMSG